MGDAPSVTATQPQGSRTASRSGRPCPAILLAATAAMLIPTAATADEHPPTGTLALRWVDASGHVLAERALDRTAVEALPQSEVHTETPWTEAMQQFSGPRIATLAALGAPACARPGTAEINAINDYSAPLPQQDWQRWNIILASRHNDRPMRVRDNGPFWVIYPLSSAPELDTQLTHSRMVWQADSITFKCD